MDRKKYTYSSYRRKTTFQDIVNHISKNKHRYLKREVNKIIGLLVILLIIFLIKLINFNSSKNIIQIIDNSINYKVDIKRDTVQIKGFLVKFIDASRDKFEEMIYKEKTNEQLEETEEVFNETGVTSEDKND